MPKIDITRTELVWPGKYDEDGNLASPRRVSLPFQVIERVNETRSTREQKVAELRGHYGTLFDYWQEGKTQTTDPGDGWRNKLIWGDNLYVMGSLLEKFAGKIDLIYIDPPFATGADFSVNLSIGDQETELVKKQTMIEEKAYRDTWGNGLTSYLKMMQERLVLIKEFLSPTGSLFVHLDWHVCHYLKSILDEIFGIDHFCNEIVWQKIRTRKGQSKNFGNVHDLIFWYSNTDNYLFQPQYIPHEVGNYDDHYTQVDESGRRFRLVSMTQSGNGPSRKFGDQMIAPPPGKHWVWSQERINEAMEQGLIVFSGSGTPNIKRYLDQASGVHVVDIWTDIFPVNAMASERQDYATQKPESLLERIIKASSVEGSVVADFFCGSGTTLAVAERLNRRWIGCDLGRYAVHTSRKRLMEIPACRPFEILNLGRYERQVWQGVTFDGQKQAQQMLIFEYLKFILELYGAQPLAGTQVLHGKKGSAVVHVGAVDAPVTIDEVLACLVECKQMGQKELHILGWEWEMGLANLMVDEARGQGIKLLMLTIPREVMEQQAVQKGDIHFYELAYLETNIQAESCKATVSLTDFVIPNDELIPPEVRQKIKKWSDYVDYWAIDWDFQNDTFVNSWTSYRTRKERTLQLKSETHEYPAPGTYRIVVKVIDIFGNDTSQIFEVTI